MPKITGKKKFHQNLRFQNLFVISLLLILALIPWWQLPQMIIRGDGFVYMVSATLKTFFSNVYFYTGFELSAAVLGSILPKFFKTDMSLYFTFSLFIMMTINILFYALLRVITKHKFISFIGALMFAVNYFGNWDMYSQHCYCFVIERIVSVPFLILSFTLLHMYLEKKIRRYLISSLALYFFAIGIAHFAVLFTASFVLYPFFWYLFSKKIKKNYIIKGLVLSISFLSISVFFVLIQKITYSTIGPEQGIIEYFLNPSKNQYLEKMLRQLIYWSQYGPVIQDFDKVALHSYLSVKNAVASTPYITILYVFVGIIIYQKLPNMRALLLTTIFGTASIFFLNSWFGQYDVLFQPDSNRYLYFPTILLVLFWTLFLWVLWQSKKTIAKLLFIFIVVLYYLLNWLLIKSIFREVLIWDRSTKVTYQHMNTMRNSLSKGTLVVAPYPEVGVYESVFFTEQIGNKEVIFIGEYNPYRNWKKIASESAHVIRLNYNKTCDCIREKVIK